MHELAVCQGLMTQVEQLALENRAASVEKIFISVGALSGVELPLLERAFEIARMGTVAELAELNIETGPIIVECCECGASTEARVNRLLCGSCQNWRVKVTAGDELLLLRFEFCRSPHAGDDLISGKKSRSEPAREMQEENHV
jgi:hydrogenase nickel incorporation protein HypA/HybF